jgi:hypothetical protein
LRTTIPHVLHAYGTVSVLDIKRRAEERRRFITESPSRRAVFAAVAVLTADDPGVVFSQAQVLTTMAELGHHWARATVGDVFMDEASAAQGRLRRVRRAQYRLRAEDHRPLPVTRALAPVRDHILVVLRELAADGRKRVTRAEVTERLAASGLSYSQSAVRHGLQQLSHATPAVVALGPTRGGWLILV